MPTAAVVKGDARSMVMQKRYVLMMGMVAGVGLFTAQTGPACPYEHARPAAVQPAAAESVGTPAEGSFFYLAHSDAFAP
jgi:hypothetical protein